MSQSPFLKFRINNSIAKDKKPIYSFLLRKYFRIYQFLNTHKLQHRYNEQILSEGKQEFSIFRNSFEFLEYPFKLSCSYYNKHLSLFEALSHHQCIHQCVQNYCRIFLNCSCLLIDETINEIYAINIVQLIV